MRPILLTDTAIKYLYKGLIEEFFFFVAPHPNQTHELARQAPQEKPL